MKDYSKKIKPLNDLLKGYYTNSKEKGKSKVKPPPWKWGDEESKAFENIKVKLTSPPILAYADFDKPLFYTRMRQQMVWEQFATSIRTVRRGL
jgi:hypothetical protein